MIETVPPDAIVDEKLRSKPLVRPEEPCATTLAPPDPSALAEQIRKYPGVPEAAAVALVIALNVITPAVVVDGVEEHARLASNVPVAATNAPDDFAGAAPVYIIIYPVDPIAVFSAVKVVFAAVPVVTSPTGEQSSVSTMMASNQLIIRLS